MLVQGQFLRGNIRFFLEACSRNNAKYIVNFLLCLKV